MTDATLPPGPAPRRLRLPLPSLSLFSDPVAVGGANAVLALASMSLFLGRAWFADRWMALPHKDVGVVDFAAFWASAKAVLAGHGAWAYDWRHLQPILEHASRGPIDGKLPIYYPPPFLLLITPLGLAPYRLAFFLWFALGLAAFGSVLRLASRRWSVFFVGMAGIGVLSSAIVGQNGLYTAALLLGGLALTDRRPLLAGVLLGLLCCKPQFALLAPVALAAGGRWRTAAAAAATVLVLVVAAGLVLGWSAYPAFFAAGAYARQTFAGAGWLPWAKVQTVYGALRQLHAGAAWAFGAYGVVALAAAAAVAWLWRRGARAPLRLAVVAAGAYLATPYAFSYDAAFLAMATAFILADVDADRPLHVAEMAGLMLAFALPFVANPWPTTAPAAALLLALTVWRALRWTTPRITEISPPTSHPYATVEASY